MNLIKKTWRWQSWEGKQPWMLHTKRNGHKSKKLKNNSNQTSGCFLSDYAFGSELLIFQQPMGVNSLKKIISTTSHHAGLPKTDTNHWTTTIMKRLSAAGVGALWIMSITGHINEQSLKHYITTPVVKRRALSKKLQSNNTAAVALSPSRSSNGDAISDQVISPSIHVSCTVRYGNLHSIALHFIAWSCWTVC